MHERNNSRQLSRRSLLKTGATGTGLALAGSGLSVPAAGADTGAAPARPQGHPGSMIGVPFDEYGEQVRVGIVGLGQRGIVLLESMLRLPEVRITALCDIQPAQVRSAVEMVIDAGHPEPATYDGHGGEWNTPDEHYDLGVAHSEELRRTLSPVRDRWETNDYRALCARDDVDIVINATSWEWHHPICLTAMFAGKHTGVEVPLAMELPYLWDLVDASERTRRHCVMLEQVPYGQTQLRLLNMSSDGVFGDLLCGYGGYHNEGRQDAFDSISNRNPLRYPEGWRRRWSYRRDGDFYSMHGVSNIAMYMNVNRGDRFETIFSTSTPSLGLTQYRAAHVPRSDSAWNDPEYIKGDRSHSLITTAQGRTIEVSHDETVPSPYSTLNWLTGVKASFKDYPARIFIDGETTGNWDDFDQHAEPYEHWLWEREGDENDHMFFRLFQSMRLGLVPDIDVYDSATWTVPLPLSTESIKRGEPVRIPDFTRGEWEDYRDWFDRPNPE